MRGVDSNNRLLPNLPVEPTPQEQPTPPARTESGDLNGRSVQQEPASVPRRPESAEVGESSTSKRTLAGEAIASPPAAEGSAAASTWRRGGYERDQVRRTEHANRQTNQAAALQRDAQERALQRDLSALSVKIERVATHSVGTANGLRRDADAIRNLIQQGRHDDARQRLDGLMATTDRHHAPRADVEILHNQILEIKRWDCCNPKQLRHLKDELKAIEKHLAKGELDHAAPKLTALKNDVAQLRAPLNRRFAHETARTRAHGPVSQLENLVARAALTSPALAARFTVYQQASEAAQYQPGASEAALSDAIRTLDEAANRLLDALIDEIAPRGQSQGHPLFDELQSTLKRICSNIHTRTELVKPDNLRQMLLSRSLGTLFDTDPPRVQLAWLRRAQKLLAPAVAPNAGAAPRPAAANEKKYFRALQADGRFLSSLSTIVENSRPSSLNGYEDELSGPERRAAEAYLEALKEVPDAVIGHAPSEADRQQQLTSEAQALTNDPEFYTKALARLEVAKRHADTLVDLLQQRTVRELHRIDHIANPAARSAAAADFMESFLFPLDELSVASRVLTAEQQVRLLNALRAESIATQKKKLPDRFHGCQSRLYKSTRLTNAFRETEKRVRKDVVADLMTSHKYELQQARDKWPTMSDKEKLQTMKLIINAYCKIAGFEPPATIAIHPLASSATSAQWDVADRSLTLNQTGKSIGDFEAAMNSVFHENSHNWQDQLGAALRARPPRITEQDPNYWQVQLFATNNDSYEKDSDAAYRAQPLEAHAMMAGAKFGRDLMRALDA
jgi:hypothetical protein